MHLDKYLDYRVSRKEKSRISIPLEAVVPFHMVSTWSRPSELTGSGHPEVESNRNGGEGAASALQEEFSCWPARGDS